MPPLSYMIGLIANLSFEIPADVSFIFIVMNITGGYVRG